MSQTDSYSQLSESIQRALWKLGWEKLRPIQDAAIDILVNSGDDLIISARTASGKTEAAFLPILSLISKNSSESVRVVYVGPLKALINDQFRRLEELCEFAQIPVHRWHGDVSASKKQKFLNNPGGVLLITPESIESLFVNRSTALGHVFHSLSFIVIDEIHALQGTERGTHLRSLLYRLDKYAINRPRIVGLSATIGDSQMSAEWIRPSAPNHVQLIEDNQSKKTIQYGIFLYKTLQEESEDDERKSPPPPDISEDLHKSFSHEKNLIFANSRQDVEWYTDDLNRLSAKTGRPDQFLIHHGALSREIREHTEKLMQGKNPYTTVCSSTLELGIDIGNVRAVGQIGCPWSVSSLVQRLGRSGREENQPQIMRVFLLEDEVQAESHLCKQLYPSLIQTISITELMREPWVEPQETTSGDLSTLVQQILSVIAETGGIQAQELFQLLVTNGEFRQIDQTLFVDILRQIGKEDLIEQTALDELILGLKGEKIVRSYEFYSAFATPPEFRVVHQGQTLGMLPMMAIPSEKQQFLLAGKRWQVVGIDYDRREIGVIPARGRKRPVWPPMEGKIHRRVRKMMHEVLSNQNPLGYLNQSGNELVAQARTAFRNAGLLQQSLVQLSPSKTLWFTWTGTNIQKTLLALLESHGVDAVDYRIAIEMDISLDHLREVVSKITATEQDPLLLAQLINPKQRRKYDYLLSEEQLEWSISQDVIDLDGANEEIEDLMKTLNT